MANFSGRDKTGERRQLDKKEKAMHEQMWRDYDLIVFWSSLVT